MFYAIKNGVLTFKRGKTALWQTGRRWMVELEAVCEPRSSICSSGLAQTASVTHLVGSTHQNIVQIDDSPFSWS